MCGMHFCEMGLIMLNESKEMQENGNSVQLDGTFPALSCKFCGEKQGKEYVKHNGLSPYGTPIISPVSSLTSSDSTVSICSDFSVDVCSCSSGFREEGGTDSSQEDFNFRPNGHLQNITLPIHVNGINRNKMLGREQFRESSSVNNTCTTIGTGEGQQTRENAIESSSLPSNEETETSYPLKGEIDAQVWVPPEPEVQEDDMEGSVANYDDDDDECGDGTKWGKSSCLSSFGEEGSGGYRFKEEKQKAMDEVMNGKFKALVSQLLRSVGVTSLGGDSDSWVDIVTYLSWEAASFVKPDAIVGTTMDPDGYVKVKCIASGSRSQSQVIRGLVFKKRAAHKHMPSKYKNPRLLLIEGSLGLSSSGLSSFESMDQEKQSLKSINEIIAFCHPNVVLVERTVSRDIQECILAKGLTLVFDMKLHRLERVACCTGSPILNTDNLIGQQLKQCDSFHFEKIVEEHNTAGEDGKKPKKTLMFIEGCPTRLGCTILLKGSHTEELKRIKCVVQCAVIMAYHLILETSFILDQRAMFSTIPPNEVASAPPMDQQSESIQSNNSIFSCVEDPSVNIDSSCTTDVPISNGFHYSNLKLEGNSAFSYELYNPVILSGLSSLSDSFKKVIGDSFPIFSSASHKSMSTYFGFNGRDPDNQIQPGIHVSTSLEAFDHCDEDPRGSFEEDKTPDYERSNSSSSKAPPDTKNSDGDNEEQVQSRESIRTVLDSESILVLMSSRNASGGTICEQSHFSHIKFYRDFDVPLGKFLQDNLLNQKLQCATCNETPDAHFYYYAHHNKQLTIQVKRLPGDKCLPGQAERKLWMWSRCGKCKSHKGNLKSTKRVLISMAACGLSFGKFLELSFSNHSSFSRSSRCGHSLDRDFLFFFGLGHMVAMLRFSQVVTYSVDLPPQELEFSNSIKGDLLRNEIEKVYSKGIHLFEDVANFLHKIGSRFSGSSLNLGGSIREFSDIVEMLKVEKSQFEINIQNTVVKSGIPDEAVHKLLSLNRFLCDVFLEAYVWDQRLHSLLSSDSDVIITRTSGQVVPGGTYLNKDGSYADMAVSAFGSVNEVIENCVDTNITEKSIESKEFPVTEIPIERSREHDESYTSPIVAVNVERSTNGSANIDGPLSHPYVNDDENCREDNLPLDAGLQVDKSNSITTDPGDSFHDLNVSQRCDSPLEPDYRNLRGWFWSPFLDIQREYMNDLQGGHLSKFESICSSNMESIPRVRELIAEERSRMHIALDSDNYIVSDYEDEFSSIIACALALLKDLPVPAEVLNEDARMGNAMAAKTYESSQSLNRLSSLASPHWSSFSSLDLNGFHSSLSFDESYVSSFDGMNLLDSSVFLRAPHPEVSMGVGKLPGKGKYTVTCLYAGQFRDLRNRCCPSELDYIASLSRCRNWDAKGGKSKSFFAKTLDDRFILKEIKKTEFDSFVKFAPDYFTYMNDSFEQGNQTCLAKILGIYQVTIRRTKSGKEIKHDLMVMENLSFGHNITRQYDLKGALHARFNSAADGSGDVLLDQNFVDDMNASPLYVGTKSKHFLQRAIWNDTTFLNSINVMDYSLLVGVDTQRRELVCGIIDYLRQYTWDKQLETWVKSSLVVPRNQLPTICSPKEYKKRFRKFITTYFLSVPDHWCLRRSSNPCELCGTSEDDSSDTNSRGQPNGISA